MEETRPPILTLLPQQGNCKMLLMLKMHALPCLYIKQRICSVELVSLIIFLIIFYFIFVEATRKQWM